MPHMDGLTCLDRIMVERPCPVVMVSALTDAGATERSRRSTLGAVDFVAKPGRAVSLSIDTLGPRLVEKVRAASKAQLRRSHRLGRARSPEERPSDPQHRPATMRDRTPDRPRLGSSRSGAAGPARRYAARRRGVVLVGTSTGGPPALDALLVASPGRFPVADPRRPAHARDLHGAARPPARQAVRADGRRGHPPDAAAGPATSISAAAMPTSSSARALRRGPS